MLRCVMNAKMNTIVGRAEFGLDLVVAVARDVALVELFLGL